MAKSCEHHKEPETVNCSMCGHPITPEEGAAACKNCSLFGVGGCRMIRCPQCGYEMPPPARLPMMPRSTCVRCVIGMA